TPRRRPRYSAKTRTRIKKHDPPEILKQYHWKPWTKVPDKPVGLEAKKNGNPSQQPGQSNPSKRVTALTPKAGLVRGMTWEHPIVTVQAGTLSANIKRAIGDSPLVPEIESCLKEAVRLASDIKRSGQELIGRYIEAIFASSSELSSADRTILHNICPRVSSKVSKGTGQGDHDRGKEDDRKEEQDGADD
ncbi:hypothetical protein BGZ65_009441, partial [Modicella reniformis]